jgi:hypothetical protein
MFLFIYIVEVPISFCINYKSTTSQFKNLLLAIIWPITISYLIIDIIVFLITKDFLPENRFGKLVEDVLIKKS